MDFAESRRKYIGSSDDMATDVIEQAFESPLEIDFELQSCLEKITVGRLSDIGDERREAHVPERRVSCQER